MTANDLSTRDLVRLQPLIDWQLAKRLNGFPYTNVWKKLKALITSQCLELLKRFLFKQFQHLKNYLTSILYKAIISKPCFIFPKKQ